MLTLNDGRKELYQWDTGRIATTDVECDVVHFSNLKYGESLAVEVKNGEVVIPNKLLMSGEPIYCWAFVSDENGEYTKQEQTLNVNKRAKPSDYVYTETEVISIERAVNDALEKAKESGEFKGDKGDKGEQGIQGEKGDKGDKGDTIEVVQGIGQSTTAVMSQKASTDNFAAKTDLNAEEAQREHADTLLRQEISGKLSEPVEGLAVGRYFKVAQIDENGHAVLEAVDAKSIGVQDVQINGDSIVNDGNGVTDLPIVNSAGTYGLVKFGAAKKSSIYFDSNGNAMVASAASTQIDNRTVYPIFPNMLDYAVKKAMCDGKGEAWTDAERIDALLRMGCTVDDNGFVKWAAQEVAE